MAGVDQRSVKSQKSFSRRRRIWPIWLQWNCIC